VGNGVHIPRALIAVALALLATGCIDFVEPTELNIGGPAVFQASMRLDDNGAVRVDASLDPGIDADGLRRNVTRDSVVALARPIPPDEIDAQGARTYLGEWVTSPGVVAGPLTLEAPIVAGVDPPPSIRWGGLVRLDPVLINLPGGDDLALRTMVVGRDQPDPLNASWNLLLRRGDAFLRIGANGPPPPVIEVPAAWLPAPSGVIEAELTYVRSHSVGQSGTSYVGTFAASVTLRWTIVRILGEPGTAPGNGAER